MKKKIAFMYMITIIVPVQAMMQKVARRFFSTKMKSNLSSVQKLYLKKGRKAFIDEIKCCSLSSGVVYDVGKLFVLAPWKNNVPYMYKFTDRAHTMKLIAQAAQNDPHYDKAIEMITNQFEQDSIEYAKSAVMGMQPHIAIEVFEKVPNCVNNLITYHCGHDKRRGTLLDYIESEQLEEFNSERIKSLQKVKAALLVRGGKPLNVLNMIKNR